MKKYILFAGYVYYPAGGWSDFRGSFDTVEEAEKAYDDLARRGFGWYQIVDTTTWSMHFEF